MKKYKTLKEAVAEGLKGLKRKKFNGFLR